MTTMNGEDDIYDVLDRQSFAAFLRAEAKTKTAPVRYQIKIVPDPSPNDDGKWIDVPRAPPRTRSWTATAEAYAEFVPQGHHIVAVQTVT